MITYNDFRRQPVDKQICLLDEYGSCVMSIRYYSYKVTLYLLGNYYLEVFYNHKKDLIEKIIPLDTNHSRMNFYADQIRLPERL